MPELRGVSASVADRRLQLKPDPLEPMNMGSGREEAAAVHLLVTTQRRDAMSKYTATTSTIQITSAPILLLAFELGEESWLLGFSRGFGEKVLRRKIPARDTAALMREIARAKEQLELADDASVHTCYEAGRDGFWLHRFLEAHGVENSVIDSASIEVNRRKRRAKTDRLDVVGLLDLLARHLAGSHKPPFSVVSVPSLEDEDLRHLGRELKLAKKDRTRISNRIKGLQLRPDAEEPPEHASPDRRAADVERIEAARSAAETTASLHR